MQLCCDLSSHYRSHCDEINIVQKKKFVSTEYTEQNIGQCQAYAGW